MKHKRLWILLARENSRCEEFVNPFHIRRLFYQSKASIEQTKHDFDQSRSKHEDHVNLVPGSKKSKHAQLFSKLNCL